MLASRQSSYSQPSFIRRVPVSVISPLRFRYGRRTSFLLLILRIAGKQSAEEDIAQEFVTLPATTSPFLLVVGFTCNRLSRAWYHQRRAREANTPRQRLNHALPRPTHHPARPDRQVARRLLALAWPHNRNRYRQITFAGRDVLAHRWIWSQLLAPSRKALSSIPPAAWSDVSTPTTWNVTTTTPPAAGAEVPQTATRRRSRTAPLKPPQNQQQRAFCCALRHIKSKPSAIYGLVAHGPRTSAQGWPLKEVAMADMRAIDLFAGQAGSVRRADGGVPGCLGCKPLAGCRRHARGQPS